VRGEDLVVVMRREVAGIAVEGDRLLARIMIASAKPRSSMMIARMTYMMPIFL
jgi:hypothetical protein